MYGKVKKIDYYTNKVIKEYRSPSVTAMLNGDSAPYVINQCKRRGGVINARQEYYYRWADDNEPNPHYYIEIYNLDFELIGKYISIQKASEATSVRRESIVKQINNPLPMRKRKSPSSGLYFVKKEVQ